MKESTKWITFLAIILSLGIGGFLLGLRRGKSELFASAGMAFGFFDMSDNLAGTKEGIIPKTSYRSRRG